MAEQKFISELFAENSKFILVGLTGRTGSGCTTTADILEKKAASFPDPENLNGFYDGLDIKRYLIAKKFAEANWNNFYSIKVSDLISIYLLNMGLNKLAEFIIHCSQKKQKTKIREKIKTGVTEQSQLAKKYKKI